MNLKSFAELRQQAGSKKPGKIAVVNADSTSVLKAVCYAVEHGMVEAVLIGNRNGIGTQLEKEFCYVGLRRATCWARRKLTYPSPGSGRISMM